MSDERLKTLRRQEAELTRLIPLTALHIQARLKAQLATLREEIRKLEQQREERDEGWQSGKSQQ